MNDTQQFWHMMGAMDYRVAIDHCRTIGYSDGAYIYARMLAHYYRWSVINNG